MLRYLLFLMLFIAFSTSSNAQILDSIRVKTSKIDTLVLITQQDADHYILSRGIKDTVGKLETYIRIIKNAKVISARSPNLTYERILQFTEQNEKFQKVFNTPITLADISEYMLIRKIVGDTTGKTADYLKIIKLAKLRMVNMERTAFVMITPKKTDYENTLIEVEEFYRIRSMIDKVLVIKSERKMYLQKKGKTLRTYSIGLGPKPIGQKEYEGDGKTPEGFYHLDWQKWDSPTFHSYHISYPNDIDLARAKAKGLTAGSNIMIHGTSKGLKKKKDWTNGCIALNNTDMAEFRKIVFLDTPVEIRK